MDHQTLRAQLGHFVLTFQAIEAAMVELTVMVVSGDPEYTETLTAELEFDSKARALDVIYTRFAQIHGLSDKAPHPEFHALVVRIQKIGKRRNELVHSQYGLLTTVDGEPALARKPTRLHASKGVRERPSEDILSGHLHGDVAEMNSILIDLEGFRLSAIETLHPDY